MSQSTVSGHNQLSSEHQTVYSRRVRESRLRKVSDHKELQLWGTGTIAVGYRNHSHGVQELQPWSTETTAVGYRNYSCHVQRLELCHVGAMAIVHRNDSYNTFVRCSALGWWQETCGKEDNLTTAGKSLRVWSLKEKKPRTENSKVSLLKGSGHGCPCKLIGGIVRAVRERAINLSIGSVSQERRICYWDKMELLPTVLKEYFGGILKMWACIETHKGWLYYR